jgi:hypothetical protein
MLKVALSLIILTSLLMSQKLSSTLTQRGGVHNSLFLNPTYLIDSKSNKDSIEIDFINSTLIINKRSLDFIKELNQADGNQEISQLLKENIGKTLSLSANNFSSIHQTKGDTAWSIGIVNTLDGYFITHSGFGSKRAMETYIEKNEALIGTVVQKQNNLYYGVNLKLINKSETLYNYAINEMAIQDSIWDYFNNSHTQKKSLIGLDMGFSYTFPKELFKSKISLALLDIGENSFYQSKAQKESISMGLLVEYKNTYIKIDHLNNQLKADISRDFFNQKLEIHSGIIYNALSLGLIYKFSIFNIGLFSYRVKEYNQQETRKNELSLGIKW